MKIHFPVSNLPVAFLWPPNSKLALPPDCFCEPPEVFLARDRYRPQLLGNRRHHLDVEQDEPARPQVFD